MAPAYDRDDDLYTFEARDQQGHLILCKKLTAREMVLLQNTRKPIEITLGDISC